ncbi:MAG: DUF998 domain-containing protein [Nitrososphaeria archaeon]
MKSIFKRLLWTGALASIYIWIIIFICYHYNPGFVFTQGALSQFGAPSANYPFIYNIFGMIVTGFLLMLFSVSLAGLSENKLETVGSSFLFISSIFLMLIGVFFAGTRPHVFISTYFYYQADLAIIVFGFGSLLHDKTEGILSLAIGISAPVIALLVRWPSSATLEVFGIICIEAWALMTIYRARKW